MTTTKIPRYGDPEILPKGIVRRPSAERMTYDHSGNLTGTTGPLTEERFYEAPDLDKLPQWTRTRGNEWTTAEFRQHVFRWFIKFFATRPWAKQWDVKEVASSQRNAVRLDESQLHLVIGITRADKTRFESAATFPLYARENNLSALLAVLAQAEHIFDVLAAAAPAE
jgi:hypothetical protein